MDLPGIPLLDVLRQRMSWLNSRQSVLSQNVANVDTPGYLAKDLKAIDFEKLVRQSPASLEGAGTLRITNPHHIQASSSRAGKFREELSADGEANPTGNTVSLEEEMIKVADTQAQYQAASNLYSKAIGLLRTAIGH